MTNEPAGNSSAQSRRQTYPDALLEPLVSAIDQSKRLSLMSPSKRSSP
jgi:hypothetical protein